MRQNPASLLADAPWLVLGGVFPAMFVLDLFPGLLSPGIHMGLCAVATLLGIAAAIALKLSRAASRAEAEAAARTLRASEERLQRVLGASRDGWWDWDLVGNGHFMSPQWWQMLGYRDNETALTLENLNSWFHPEDADRVNAAFLHAMRSETGVYELEFRLRHKLGHYVPVLCRALITKNPQGVPIRFSGINTDMTAKKAAEEQIRESANLLGLVRDAMIVMDPEYRVLRWNKAAEFLYGWQESEIVGRTLGDFLRTEFPGSEREAMLARLLEQGYWQGEVIQSTRTGARIVVEAESTVIRDAAGKLTGFLSFNRDITDRKLAERRIIESEQRWKFAIDGAGDGLWDWDLTTGRAYYSRRWMEILGLADGDLSGNPEEAWSWVHPEDRDGARRAFQDHLDGCTPHFEAEQRVVGKDGATKWVLSRGKVMERDVSGKPSRVIGTWKDISGRKAAQAEMLRMNELHRAIVEDNPYPLISADRDGLITLWNPAAERMLGYSAEETVGRLTPAIIHVPGEVAARAEEFSRELGRRIEPGFEVFVVKARERLPNEHEWTYVRKDGSRFRVRLAVSCLRDPDGGIAGYMGIAADCTAEAEAREAAQQAARGTEQALLRLQEQKFAMDQHSLVSVAGADGRITYANEKLCRVSGYEREELLGRNHRVLNSGLHDREFFASMYRSIFAGQVWRGELRNRRKDGTFYWVDTTIVPFLGEDGRPVQFVSIRTDVTDRKAAEADLLVAKDTAERSNRAKSEFLATMSHEIRTPLNGVLGLAHLLLETPLSEEQRDFVRTMHQSGSALLSIINDILDYSKIEAGKMDVELLPFNLADSIHDVIEILSLNAGERNIRMEVEYPGAEPRMALGDPGRVRQVLMNLVSNAIKFTQDGEVRIRARAGGEGLYVEVEDTGIGIPADKQSRIFSMFSQADASTTRKFGGTGLGLAISRRLTELMGGELGFRSVPDRGSTFWMTLPRAPEPAPGSVPEPAERGAAAPVAGTLRPKAGTRVLVVEDNIVNQKVAAGMLRKFGCVVDLASNGIEALDMVKKFPYAFVFMDCQMPEMDGFESTRRIRAWESQTRNGEARLPIVALTANAMSGDRDRCLEAGMDEFLSKPIRSAELLNVLVATRQ